jgi:hypothetical protein
MANANNQIAQYTWGSGSVMGLCGTTYWRFLYEACGGMADGVENPAAGMTVVRNTLSTLYGGQTVDITSSADLLNGLPKVMDRVLAETPSCPFRTFEDSLMHFSRAIYSLRVEGGRCVAPGLPVGCGLYDPNGLYDTPPVANIEYAGDAQRLYHAAVRRSYGMAFVDIQLGTEADGRPLMLEFEGDTEGDSTFGVQVWRMHDLTPLADPEIVTQTCPDGRLVYVIPEVDTSTWDLLGVIVTRLDPNERPDDVAGYTIRLRAGRPDDLCQAPPAAEGDPAGIISAEMIFPADTD